MTVASLDPTEAAYDAIASAYDLFTADYDYGTWLTAIERLARAHGLSGRRLLDVACGTGNSFMPLLHRGYDITACDISKRMLDHARAKACARARLHHADMCELPMLGEFDLITCLDDALNYLPDEDALRRALVGMRANLAPAGLIVFDVNSLLTYRTDFSSDAVVATDSAVVAWRGRAPSDFGSGDSAQVDIDAFVCQDGSDWRRQSAVHRQVHHPAGRIRRALAESRLGVVARLGQRTGARLDDDFDELKHSKCLYLAAIADD
jgi:SAM-dependent methyltransferase